MLVTGQVRRLAPAGRGGRHRPPFRARALRRDARVVRHRRDVPARGVRGLHPDRRARGRARRRTRSEARATHDALVGSGRNGLRSRGLRRCCAPTTASSSSTTSRDARSTCGGSPAAGILDADELREVERRSTSLAWEPGHEDVHTAIEVQLGELGRKIQAGRSRNDQVATAFRLYVADACARGDRDHRALRQRGARPGRGGGETPMPGYTHLQRAQPVTVGPPARLGRDARPRSRALPVRRRAGEAVAARLRRARGLDPRPAAAARRPAAELPRRRRRPRLRARLPLRVRAARVASLADRRGARALVDQRVRVRPPARGRGYGLVGDAAEAEPGRRRARPRQGGHRARSAAGPARDGEGAAARLQPRPAGGQAAGLRRAEAT